MAKERLKSPRARLFIALDLPGAVRKEIGAWGRQELVDPALRAVGEPNLHITLAFLGYVAEKEISRLTEIVEASRAGAPRVELCDPVARPERGRPRLFALPADSPETVAMQSELQERLIAARLYEPEKRAFWPHVTVARVRREERRSARVARAPGGLPKGLLQPFDGVRIVLYRSRIQPQGAQYTPLAQVELPRDGRQ